MTEKGVVRLCVVAAIAALVAFGILVAADTRRACAKQVGPYTHTLEWHDFDPDDIYVPDPHYGDALIMEEADDMQMRDNAGKLTVERVGHAHTFPHPDPNSPDTITLPPGTPQGDGEIHLDPDKGYWTGFGPSDETMMLNIPLDDYEGNRVAHYCDGTITIHNKDTRLDLIREWGASGEVCEVFGHRWVGGRAWEHSMPAVIGLRLEDEGRWRDCAVCGAHDNWVPSTPGYWAKEH